METSEPDCDVSAMIVKSLVLYSVAEAQAGHVTTISVTITCRTFSVSDNGRGHSVDRAVDGVPYLNLIYNHFDYPFDASSGPAVQLQGIATSLVRSMCSDFTLTVRKAGTCHQLQFLGGTISTTARPMAPDEGRGNAISGTVMQSLPCAPDAATLERWLQGVAGSVPGLNVVFNGRRVLAPHPSETPRAKS